MVQRFELIKRIGKPVIRQRAAQVAAYAREPNTTTTQIAMSTTGINDLTKPATDVLSYGLNNHEAIQPMNLPTAPRNAKMPTSTLMASRAGGHQLSSSRSRRYQPLEVISPPERSVDTEMRRVTI